MNHRLWCCAILLVASCGTCAATPPGNGWRSPGLAKAASTPCEFFSELNETLSAAPGATGGIPGTPSPGEKFTVSVSGPGSGTFRIVDDPLGTNTFAGPTSAPGTLTYTVSAAPSTNFGVGYYFDSGSGTVTITASCSAATATTDLPPAVVVSHTVSGAPTTRDSTHTALSADGSTQVFESQEKDLVAANGQTANGQDIYRSVNGQTVLENKGASGSQLLGTSSLPAISQDGGIVAFVYNSSAKALRAKDFVTGQMFAGASGAPKHQVDLGPGGAAPNGAANGAPSVSNNGAITRLAFCSSASNLVAGDSNGQRDVFLVDPSNPNQPAERISTDSNGAQIAGDSCEPVLSADGTKLAFTVSAPGLYGTSARQVVRKDLNSGALELISHSTAQSSHGANADSSEPSISADGGVVAFTSAASNLDNLGSPVGGSEAFVSVAQAGSVGAPRLLKRVRSGDGTVPNGLSQHPQVSGDGGVVVMTTFASNFFGGKAASACGAVAVTTNFFAPTLLGSNLCSGTTRNQNPAVSGDGSMVGFDSNAPQSGTSSSNSNTYGQNAGKNNVGIANLSGDFTGQWFDPNQNGQGIVIDVLQPDANGNRVMLMTWFVYSNGQPTWVQGSGTPKAASGDASGSVVVQMSQVGIFHGSAFPRGAANVSASLWGSVTLTFKNANTGTMAWTSSYPGFNSGSMDITHFVPVDLPSQDAAGAQIRACYSGNWFNPAQSGHGFEFEVIPSSPPILSVDWFAYAPNGAPVWLQGAGTITGNSASMQLQLLDGSGAQFPPNFNPGALTQHLWGTVNFTFADAGHATVSWNSSLPGYGSGSQPLQPTLGVGVLDRRGCP